MCFVVWPYTRSVGRRGGMRVDVSDLPGDLSEVMCIRGHTGTPASLQWVSFVYLDSDSDKVLAGIKT